jgi:hypothetical protein
MKILRKKSWLAVSGQRNVSKIIASSGSNIFEMQKPTKAHCEFNSNQHIGT